MEHKFRDILEHDMDMLILEEFACSNEFANKWYNKFLRSGVWIEIYIDLKDE